MRIESWDGYLRRSALSECRNPRMRCGCEAVDGYNSGERRVGIMTRWMVVGG